MKEIQREKINILKPASFFNGESVNRVYINNMCCARCLVEVKKIFRSINLNATHFQLGGA